MKPWTAVADWWTAKRRHEDAIAGLITTVAAERRYRLAGEKDAGDARGALSQRITDNAERLDALKAAVADYGLWIQALVDMYGQNASLKKRLSKQYQKQRVAAIKTAEMKSAQGPQ